MSKLEYAGDYRAHGYSVIPGVASPAVLSLLRSECDAQLARHKASMDRVGADVLGLSHRDRRYFVPNDLGDSPAARTFIASESVAAIVAALLGPEAYVFLQLYVVKSAHHGLPFGWHQDSGYLLGLPHTPYLSLWCALDDADERNGTIWVRRPESPEQPVLPHVKEKATNDFVAVTTEDAPGISLPVRAGDAVAMSSTTLHRTGPNTTARDRRAYLVSFSAEPITDDDGQLWNLAEPYLRRDSIVFTPDR